MRNISLKQIIDAASKISIKANFNLRPDVLISLKRAYVKEKNKKARRFFRAIIDNAAVARKEKLAICQDTGLPCVFVEIGSNVRVNGDIKKAIINGVEKGYKEAYLRNSIVSDPLKRTKSAYSPAVIHLDSVKGNKIKISLLAKGFGCENKTQLKMFKPTASVEEIKKFVVEAVKLAGADACPPYVVGIGIGGTADYACFLAKKALLKKIYTRYSIRDTRYASLENDLLKQINKLNIGPMGLGGRTTVLGVNILTYPTHIAGLPVAVNINCHALRSVSITI
ncbi:MAG: fumarate hydratase [Candidatus Omnitrophota bacterium]|jgi:fumarate hydratase subunit alpha|nr:MAG: fumarate hydratase [Candidatus Omnitrophota bacterium]